MTSSNQNVDIDALLDFSDYDNAGGYQSPSLSPPTGNKNGFLTTRPPVSAVSTPIISSTNQPLTGPSHQYDLYKQQTGIVPGAIASTLAVSQQSMGYGGMDMNYMNLGSNDDLFDFNSAPSQPPMNADLEMDFESSAATDFFFDSTVNPTSLGSGESSSLPSPPSLGVPTRVWPGMHSQQAALAKAQAQRQQQQMIQQQQRQTTQPTAKPRTKSGQPSDPIVEQKITQLLNSMRAKSSGSESGSKSPAPTLNLARSKKDEDDMDEDERLLASEEGKKLSSKERRQLRNKVSARAFRSRRKEYISQLESEIAGKVNENGDLRAQNRALMEENKRLSDLTRMLLSSSSFSNFLDHLSSNAGPVTPAAPSAVHIKQEPAAQQADRRQLPKDVNPYAAGQNVQQQQIGMAMIPEQTMDFSMLSLETDSFSFQPQVFAILETPEVPSSIETSVLSGKTSNFVGEQFDSDSDKVDVPAIERPAEKTLAPESREEEPPLDREFESNPEFALYHSSASPSTESAAAPTEIDTESLSQVDIFGGIDSEKMLARYDLLDASEEERTAVLAMARVQRMSDRLEDVRQRLERLTSDM